MCKFYQIASNSLQVIHIVHELFDYPSYIRFARARLIIFLLSWIESNVRRIRKNNNAQVFKQNRLRRV